MDFVTYTAWSELPESANVLFSHGEKDSIFLSRPWFENLVANALKDGQSMLLACVLEAGTVQAILPLMRSEQDGWCSLSSYYTSLYSLLVTDKSQEAVLGCLVQGLSQLPAQQLRLYPVSKDDKDMANLYRAMEASGFDCYRSLRFYNWIHRVRGQSFESYMDDRPGRVRGTIARKQRKLERDFGYEIRLFVDDDLQQAVADYDVVYKASWKPNEAFREFTKALVSIMSAPGWLRLAILYIDGRPVAAQIWFVLHGKASIFRLVYDETWKQYSPGSILTRYLMEYVIDTDKVKEIDYLTGNESYKQDWMSERRERWMMACVVRQVPKTGVSWVIEGLRKAFSRLRNSLGLTWKNVRSHTFSRS